MNGVKIVILALLAGVWQIPTTAQGAPSAAQQAMNECAINYCGRRSPSVGQARPMWIEACFHQKMGKYPAEMGIAIKIRRRCPRT